MQMDAWRVSDSEVIQSTNERTKGRFIIHVILAYPLMTELSVLLACALRLIL